MVDVRRVLAATAALIMVGGAASAHAGVGDPTDGRIGPAYSMTANGRKLEPAGRQTTVGTFPNGGRLSPDGRFFWAVDAGHGANGVEVVDVASGHVVQKLPMPGASGGIAFASDGRTAYVSGAPSAKEQDTIAVFSVDARTGHATEREPIVLPSTSGGHGQQAGSPVGWPQGLAVAPDGKTLVVALSFADQAAIVDLPTGTSRLVKVGTLPYGVAIDRAGRTAYVTNEYDGTVSVLDLASATVAATIPVGGPSNPDGSADPNRNAHPEGVLADPRRDLLYVAVTNRDLVAVVDTAKRAVTRYVSVGRAAGLGASPVALALAPDGRTLYSADAGEDAIAAITLTPRDTPDDHASGDVRGSAPLS